MLVNCAHRPLSIQYNTINASYICPLPLPDVWSPSGPVPWLGVAPDFRVQSSWSFCAFVQPQSTPVSNSQSSGPRLHEVNLQLFFSEAEPTQVLPPFAGVGSLHCRALWCSPVSHCLLHTPQADHLPQCPSTAADISETDMNNLITHILPWA